MISTPLIDIKIYIRKEGIFMLQFSIITISTFVGILNEAVKIIASSVFKKDITKYIPLFSVIFGIGLGIAGFYTPNVDMGKNLIEAIFIGLAAGCAATGVHQIGKQLNKKEEIPGNSLVNFDIAQFIKDQTNVVNEVEEEESTEEETVLQDPDDVEALSEAPTDAKE
jgi:hypothetical protein